MPLWPLRFGVYAGLTRDATIVSGSLVLRGFFSLAVYGRDRRLKPKRVSPVNGADRIKNKLMKVLCRSQPAMNGWPKRRRVMNGPRENRSRVPHKSRRRWRRCGGKDVVICARRWRWFIANVSPRPTIAALGRLMSVIDASSYEKTYWEFEPTTTISDRSRPPCSFKEPSFCRCTLDMSLRCRVRPTTSAVAGSKLGTRK